MIEFQGLTKSYGVHRAVESLTFRVDSGEAVALLGPNGSGKTTTLKAAAGLIRPDAGRVLVGEPGRSPQEPAARTAISYLPQKVTFPEAVTGRPQSVHSRTSSPGRRMIRLPRVRFGAPHLSHLSGTDGNTASSAFSSGRRIRGPPRG